MKIKWNVVFIFILSFTFVFEYVRSCKNKLYIKISNIKDLKSAGLISVTNTKFKKSDTQQLQGIIFYCSKEFLYYNTFWYFLYLQKKINVHM